MENNRKNITLCGIYKDWLQQVVIKTWNHKTYCFCESWGGETDLRFWMFEGGGDKRQIEQVKTRGERDPIFRHFAIT